MAQESEESETPNAVPTIWQALDAWANGLSAWQQLIIKTAVAQGQLKPEQVDQALTLFLKGRGLADVGEESTGANAAVQSRPDAPLAEPLLLTKIDGLDGVNALLPGAMLTFGPALTVIYGRNGAGKSGFARMFSNACFSRQRHVIVPNIYVDGDAPAPTAQFHFSIGAAAQEPLVYGDGKDTLALRRITVFDSAVARHHITQSAAFEFRPAGFDVFPEVVRVYGLLGEKLEQAIAKRNRPNEFPAAFLGGGTVVHDAVAALTGTTDLAPIRTLAQYGESESARLSELDAQILALRSQSPKETLAALNEAKGDIATLTGILDQLKGNFEEAAISRRAQLSKEARAAAETATSLGSDQFQRPFFSAVGTPEWEAFVGSVHALAHREREDYPAEGDPCLLCERPLDATATEHIRAILAFAEGEARRAAAAAQKQVSDEAIKLNGLGLGGFSETTRVRSHVHRLAPDTESVLVAAFTAMASARKDAISALEGAETTDKPVDIAGAVSALIALGERIDGDIIRLSASDTDAALASLQAEYRVLRHRHVLSQQLAAIEAFVTDQAWVAKANAARTAFDTRAVTIKEKELFTQIVGGNYRDRFANECDLLDCRVPVELQTVGRSGQTLRSLAMRGGHKPDTILSEGEQRAVALADFLTEVAFNPASAGIVLDDPVTSQDHERRHRIAERLVTEAKARQVIVFTHDLVFLNALFELASTEDVAIESHWVDRDSKGQPGHVAHGDAPATIRIHDTTARAEQALKDAEGLSGSAREDAIRRGMGALRRTLEETVVRKLFKDAVPRWSDQVRVTTLRKINWDNAKVEEIAELYEDLSRFIDGHSHTDEASGAPPQTSDLASRIEQVKELIKWAKADRKKDT